MLLFIFIKLIFNIFYFLFFDDGLYVCEQVRCIELNNHCKDLLPMIDNDISLGKIKLCTKDVLIKLSLNYFFEEIADTLKHLFSPKDLGEVFAIALAKTFSINALVTDDIKQGGPYMTLLQFSDSVIPLDFADILILRYLNEDVDSIQTINDFSLINNSSNLNWSFVSHLKRFTNRFFVEPYTSNDTLWIKRFLGVKTAGVIEKIKQLKYIIRKEKL